MEYLPTSVCVAEVLQSVLLEVLQDLPPGVEVCVRVVLSFCRSVILSFCHSVVLSFCHSVILSFCLCVRLCLCLCLCVLGGGRTNCRRTPFFLHHACLMCTPLPTGVVVVAAALSHSFH